jgi:hypothetical protein
MNLQPISIMVAPFVSLHGVGRPHSRGRWDLVDRLPRPVVSTDGQGCCLWQPVGQISPDSVQYPPEGYKDVNCHCTTAPFTVSPEPRASLCCANLPGDSAL